MKLYLCVFWAAVATAQTTAAPETPAFVEGRVVFAPTGEPVAKAHVSLISDEANLELLATTDATGHFQFADVQPDSYQLLAAKNGYLSGRYGEVRQGDSQVLLRLHAGEQCKALVLRLFPASSLTGQIHDAEGDPMPGYNVTLWKREGRGRDAVISPTETTKADRNGRYRFEDLMPGIYWVSADPLGTGTPAEYAHKVLVDADGKPTRLQDYRTFFPAAPSLSRAQSFRLVTGQEQEGINIQVQRGQVLSITGRVIGIAGHTSEYLVTVSTNPEINFAGVDGKISSDGSFEVADLPPGPHRVTLVRQGTGEARGVGSSEVELLDRSVSNVVITPFEPAEIRARVVVEGEEKPSTIGSLFVNPVGADGSVRAGSYAFAPENGIYRLSDLSPGKYWIGFTNAGHCYLKSAKSGGSEIDPHALEVPSGAHLEVTLTYSRGVADISGDVIVPQDGLHKAANVWLIRQEDLSRAQAWNLELDQHLHFVMEDRTPGKYLALAVEDGDPDLGDNPDFVRAVRSEASAIELHENEHATLRLNLITKEVTDRIRKQLGLN